MLEYAKEKIRSLGKTVIESDAYDIADRLIAHDWSLVLAYDPKQNEYQVYDTKTFPNIQIATWADELDCRLVDKVMRADNSSSYGFDTKMFEIEHEEYTREADENIKRKQLTDSIMKEMSSADKMAKHFM